MNQAQERDITWLLDEKYGGERTPEFYADCKRLALGEPLAYLIGWAPFLGCTIHLDSHPLIPRPETELWVTEAIAAIEHGTASLGFAESPPRVLDLCAGSGCIGVAVAHALPDTLVDFAEIDQSHLATIRKNCTKNGIAAERTEITHSNLLASVRQTYDFILSNPPYIDASLHRVEPSVTLHEPHLALFGGAGGLDIISSIIAQAPAHLRPGGQLWLEHEPEQSPTIVTLGTEHGFDVQTQRDQYATERYSILVLQ